jgi:HlyD family secretion protein
MIWKFAILSLLAIALTGALLLPVDSTPGTRFGSALASTAPEDNLIAADGVVEPASETRQLSATVVGRIVNTLAGDGDRVSAGQVIAEIENADLKAQLAEAEAAAAARDSELLRLKTGARPQEISAAKAELREAEAALVMARSTSERRDALGAKEIVSKETVEQAHADRDSAQAHRDMLAQKLALLVAPPRVEDVSIAQANLESARARVAEIKAEIEKTLVRSPVNGVLLKLYRRAGEAVTNFPPTLIASVGDTSHLRVRANVDEADVAEVSLGEPVWITADAYRDTRFHGTVVHVGAQLGRRNLQSDAPENRVDRKILEVLIDLEPNARLPIGLPVDVRIVDSGTRSKTRVSDASSSMRPMGTFEAAAAR